MSRISELEKQALHASTTKEFITENLQMLGM